MIGNDVVDIALARSQSNWRREGFLQKIFTNGEQQLILTSDDPETTVWNLWSRKETAYKVLTRHLPFRRFIPLQLECADYNRCSTVNYKGFQFFTRTEITENSVYTIGATAADNLNRIIEFPADSEVTKVDHLPFIIVNGRQHPASITHHGRFHNIIALSDFI